MIGKGRTLLRRRHRHDRGAAATLVAVLLAGGVLLGMTALVVDVGKLYAEREELQSGADSAAMAIALACAMDRPECDDEPAGATAVGYASANALDGSADAIVCGSHPDLPPCDDDFDLRGNLTDCLGERPDGASFVEVRASTLTPGGSTLLPSSFARTFVSGYQGTEVGACARVAWGPPAGGLAATWSACEWDLATDGGEDLAQPPEPDPHDSFETIILFSDPASDGTCDAGPSGFDAPGAFGWLADATGNCEAEIVDDKYQVDENVGQNITQACIDRLVEACLNKEVLAVPVYGEATGQGANAEYTLAGMAGFVITGFNAPGPPGGPPGGSGPCTGGGPGGPNNVPSYLTGHQCHSSESCLIGYYVYGLVDSSEIGEGEAMGAVVVRTIG